VIEVARPVSTLEQRDFPHGARRPLLPAAGEGARQLTIGRTTRRSTARGGFVSGESVTARETLQPRTWTLGKDPGDIAAIAKLYQTLFSASSAFTLSSDERYSQVLALNILASEEPLHESPTDAELDQIASDCLVCLGAGSSLRKRARLWPRYQFSES